MNEKRFYYSPLRPGSVVYKCKGHGAEKPEHRAFYVDHFKQESGDCIVTSHYIGDRVAKVDAERNAA